MIHLILYFSDPSGRDVRVIDYGDVPAGFVPAVGEQLDVDGSTWVVEHRAWSVDRRGGATFSPWLKLWLWGKGPVPA